MVVSGTSDSVVMVEGVSDFISEEDVFCNSVCSWCNQRYCSYAK